VLLSFGIALLTVSLGSVNVIAPVVSMFFLISYGLINYATYYEARAASPSFRPRFRYFSKWASLAGAILCGGAMLAISPIAGAASIVVLFLIYQYLGRRDIPERWADAGHSHHFRRAIDSVRALDNEIEHARNWRPQILVFSADAGRRARLLTFAKWMEGHSGLTAAFRIVVGEGVRKRIETDEQEAALVAEIQALGLEVQGRAVLAADGLEALPVIVQSFGLGRIKANLVLFGWPESPHPDQLGAYVAAIRNVARLGVSVVSLSTDALRWGRLDATRNEDRRIDVWWEDNDSGRLALLTAYLCTRDQHWSTATIRLIARIDGDDDPTDDLRLMLDEARITADVVTVVSPDRDDIERICADATLVLMPMRLRTGEIIDPMGGDMVELASRLPMTAALHAGAPIKLDTDPESGLAADLAEAEEAVEDARDRVRKLEVSLVKAQSDVDKALREADERTIVEAEDRLEAIRRRAVSAHLRVERAEAEVEKLLDGR